MRRYSAPHRQGVRLKNVVVASDFDVDFRSLRQHWTSNISICPKLEVQLRKAS